SEEAAGRRIHALGAVYRAFIGSILYRLGDKVNRERGVLNQDYGLIGPFRPCLAGLLVFA
ncbi:MAG: hypothetical protein LBP74_05110, partial [Treponema sp.]|nr:hypothetical protein [Treponema sp.]